MLGLSHVCAECIQAFWMKGVCSVWREHTPSTHSHPRPIVIVKSNTQSQGSAIYQSRRVTCHGLRVNNTVEVDADL